MSRSWTQVLSQADLRANIFNYLDCKEQALVSVVSKAWNQTIKKPFLKYGQQWAMRSFPFTLSHVVYYPLNQAKVYHVRGKMALLIEKNAKVFNAIILQFDSGVRNTLDLSDCLKQNQEISTARLLSHSDFLIAMADNRKVRTWSHTNECLTLTQEISIPPNNLVRAGNLLCLESPNEWMFFNWRQSLKEERVCQGNAFRAKDPHQWEGCHKIQRPKDINARLLTFTSDKVFIGHEKWVFGSNEIYYLLRVLHLETEKIVWDSEVIVKTVYSAGRYGIAGLNDQVVITANPFVSTLAFPPCIGQIRFDVLDATNGKKIGQFTEHYDTMKDKLYAAFIQQAFKLDYKKFIWLCGDFFATWIGEALRIWHLPSQECITAIDLKNVCQPEELDDTCPGFFPIYNVVIQNKTISVCFQNLANTELRWVTFQLDIPQNRI